MDREHYIRQVEEELEHLHLDLAPVLTGEIRLGECVGDGPWRDTTQERIDQIQRTIGIYESIRMALVRRQAGEQA